MASIEELLLHKGQIEGDRRRRKGELWGAAISGLAQIPGQIYQERIARRERDEARAMAAEQHGQQTELNRQRLEAGRLELSTAQREAGKQSRLEQLWSAPGVFTPDGELNVGVMRQIVSEHAPDMWGQIEGALSKVEQSRMAWREAQSKVLAQAGESLRAAGNDPGIFQLAVSALARDGVLKRSDAEDMLERGTTPEGVGQITSMWAPQTPKLHNVPPGYQVIDHNNPQGGPVYTAPEREGVDASNSDYSAFLARWMRDRQIVPGTLTADQELEAKRHFSAAGRAPQRTPAGPRSRTAQPVDEGIQSYILDMGQRGYTRQQAWKEVLGIWGQLQKQNPSRTPARVKAEIDRLLPAKIDDDFGLTPGPPQAPPARAGGAGPVGSGAAPTTPAQPAPQQQPQQPAAGREISRAELRQLAQRLKVSEAEAERQYRNRGYVVR